MTGDTFLSRVAKAKRAVDCTSLGSLDAEWLVNKPAKLTGRFVSGYGVQAPSFGTSCGLKKGAAPAATSSGGAAPPPAPAAPPPPAPAPSTWAGPSGVECRWFTADELLDYETRRKACACQQSGMKGRCSTEGIPWGAYDGEAPPPIVAPPPPVYDVGPVSREDVSSGSTGEGWMLDPDTGKAVKKTAATGAFPTWAILAIAGVVLLGGAGLARRARKRKAAA